jgi:hypothetical protein
MDSPSPPEALKVQPIPPDRVETPSPVLGARLDPIVGTSVVPGAAVVSAATTVPGASKVSAATPVPAGSPRSSWTPTTSTPLGILADKDKDIVEGNKEK